MEKRFKSSMLGFNKKNVNNYILQLTNDMAERVSKKEETIKKLNQEISELKEKVSRFESERSVIADSIIKAKNEAKKIISEAIEQAEIQKTNILTDISKETEKLESVKTEIRDLKAAALNVVDNYRRQLEELE